MSFDTTNAVRLGHLVMEAAQARSALLSAIQEIAEAVDADKADRPAPVSFTLPTSGWTADASVSGYNYRYDLAANITANYFITAILAPSSQGVAVGCGLCGTIVAHMVNSAGKISFWAASVPESAITGTYYAQECVAPEEGETIEMAYGFVNISGGGSSGVADAIVSRLGLYLDSDNELAQTDNENNNESNEGE